MDFVAAATTLDPPEPLPEAPAAGLVLPETGLVELEDAPDVGPEAAAGSPAPLLEEPWIGGVAAEPSSAPPQAVRLNERDRTSNAAMRRIVQRRSPKLFRDVLIVSKARAAHEVRGLIKRCPQVPCNVSGGADNDVIQTRTYT
jgi:hypothetical protein